MNELNVTGEDLDTVSACLKKSKSENKKEIYKL